MVILSFLEAEFLSLGRRLARISQENNRKTETKEDEVKDFAYASPKMFAQIFQDIQDPLLGGNAS